MLRQRELEVLSLVAKGYDNKKIASMLYISIDTVKTHIANICKKWDLYGEQGIKIRVKLALLYYKRIKGVRLDEI